ncbi:aminotransferase [Mixta theicola]|uniref:Aminotransferase n=1 Tax=Mixta theicola TaxID=1458355 RepID=A0A2K1Q5A8_9GAMM|nr:DegT/DnrJ/EryC1/StrS family aminotransferase [Mixta theicola]PNS10218.1 aminotransferase [Mixta theicola]GLR11025.1 aminotransferase [Mixta theicola]
MKNNQTLVTSPLLPPLEEFIPYLENIWQSRRLTNGGPFHERLEKELADYLGVKYLSLFANGTLALMTALQALDIKGEVITTPYSFVATSHSLLWNNIKPIFIDIDPATGNLNPELIERAITAETSAILPVHCYGIPCDYNNIKKVADKHNLKVIYDAAHCFAVRNHGESILQYGDLSILSFHATKVFNTFEGGAIICPDSETKKRIDYLKNFGFADEVTVVAPGINGKMNEFQAAFGLLQIKHLDAAIEERKKIYQRYVAELIGIPGVSLLTIPDTVDWNYSYCPIFINEQIFPVSRDELYACFREKNIFVRRYFYPLIPEFPMYFNEADNIIETMPNAWNTSRSVLCLPIYPGLTEEQLAEVVGIITSFIQIRVA